MPAVPIARFVRTLWVVDTATLFAQGCGLMALSHSGTVMNASMAPEPASPLAPSEPSSSEPAPAMVKPDVTAKPETKPVATGKASWYGPGFHGKKTASGEIFDDAKLTAAHKTLPMGSKAKITNLRNGKSVKVEINDRGPYVADRVIDLSQAAAHAIGMIDRGVVPVRVDLIAEETSMDGSATAQSAAVLGPRE